MIFNSLNNDYTMNDKQLLECAADEIKRLRNANQLMAARLDMFDAVMSALHGKPGFVQQGGFSPDVLFDIEARIKELNATEPSQQV